MSDHLFTHVESAVSGDALLYLAVAALCMVVGLRFLKRAIVPAGVIVGAVAAAAVVAFALALALFFLIAAAIRLT